MQPGNVLSVTPKAAEHIKQLLDQRGQVSVGIKVGIKTRGCSGMAYFLEYADEKGPYDEVVEAHGVTVLIDPKAIMFLVGTTMDYEETDLESGFKFVNPNEKGRCGCGESFHV